MADIMIPEKVTGKIYRKRKSIQVDMTPMVDLGFLLITFFMFTTQFSKPNIMDLGLPARETTPTGNVIDYRNQLTLVIGENRVFYYQKELEDLTLNDLKETTLSGLEVAKLINKYKKMAPRPEIFTVIIKPSKDANYKNFVDMMDEMAIAKHEIYGIADLKPKELQFYNETIK